MKIPSWSKVGKAVSRQAGKVKGSVGRLGQGLRKNAKQGDSSVTPEDRRDFFEEGSRTSSATRASASSAGAKSKPEARKALRPEKLGRHSIDADFQDDIDTLQEGISKMAKSAFVMAQSSLSAPEHAALDRALAKLQKSHLTNLADLRDGKVSYQEAKVMTTELVGKLVSVISSHNKSEALKVSAELLDSGEHLKRLSRLLDFTSQVLQTNLPGGLAGLIRNFAEDLRKIVQEADVVVTSIKSFKTPSNADDLLTSLLLTSHNTKQGEKIKELQVRAGVAMTALGLLAKDLPVGGRRTTMT